MRFVTLLAALLLEAAAAQARITRLEIIHAESPAFGGAVFGAAGAYEVLRGVARGEVDPDEPANRIIQDLAFAPRNARGRVEYAADVVILKPVDLARGNGLLLYELPNRGDRYARSLTFDVGVPFGADLTAPGDGFLERQGFTLVWGGWQGDLLAWHDRVALKVPVAREPDGRAITGLVRAEFVVGSVTRSLPLSAGWFTGRRHASYPTVSTGNRTPLPDGFRPLLTVRTFEEDPRRAIPAAEWRFASCPNGGDGTPSATDICYPRGFEPGWIYELIYRARDPLVLGLGYAAIRDVVAFLTHEAQDETGRPNPLHRAGAPLVAIGHGVSQGGRNLRTFLHLGFNRDEAGRRVFAGLFPHVGSGRAALNLRFAQPGRAWGDQVDRLYPAYEFPLAYAWSVDPEGRMAGSVLLRCRATGTCPRIFHVTSAHEYWAGRESLVHTDPMGLVDLPEPPEVRSYLLSSTQHGPAADWQNPGDCRYPRNPAPHRESLRALLVALARWVKDGVEPPASRVPRIADGTLVPVEQVRFPAIPATRYGGLAVPAVPGVPRPLPQPRLDFGPLFRPYDLTGRLTLEPPRVVVREAYRVLVPQVDPDGNDVAGIRSATVGVPLGTYTGWNLGREGRWPGRFCTLQGSFIPFARTRAERLAAGDPRPSLEERYGD